MNFNKSTIGELALYARQNWATREVVSTVLFLLVAASSASLIAADTTERPNLILIIADDMNWNDCGAYGHPAIRTPNIDRLAREGIQFQHAYLTCSSCSPSRSSIVTGRYPHNTGAEQLHWPLPEGTTTFANALKSSGYYTAAAGKWHMGDAIRDHFDRIYEASTAGFVLPSGAPGQSAKMVAAQPSGCEDWQRALDECPQDRPFFLWLAALDPHREYEVGAVDPPHTKTDVVVPPHLPDVDAVREDLALYYDEISRLDEYVGRLLQQLDDRGCAENTMIVFISDNGRPFPRDKTTLYDGGIRTPFLVRWPSQVASGRTSQALVSSVDIAPTFLELAGCDPIPQLEGISILPILRNQSQEIREYAYAEDHWHDYEDHARAVMTPHFKLIRNDYPDLAGTPPADAGRSLTWQAMLRLQQLGQLNAAQQSCFIVPRETWELYDLVRDPHELTNLIDHPAYAKVRERLQKALEDWSESTQDYLPSRRTPDEFDRITGQPDHSVRVRPRPSKQQMFGTSGKY